MARSAMAKQEPSLITHCRVLTPGRSFYARALEIRDGRIAAILAGDGPLPDLPVAFDADGDWVAPGFIDIHTHGASGYDVCDGRPESVREIARSKVREGVTSFLPTTLTIGEAELEEAVRLASSYMAKQEFAKTPAMHIEGPFINPKCVGAQNPKFVRLPSWTELERLRRHAPIGLVSLAPEMPGALELIEKLAGEGVVASLAHSAANWSQFQRAKSAGATHLTHFCNQMSPLHHREIGLVGAGLLDRDIMIEMICDTIHLCPEMIALAFRHVPTERIMLITDSVAASWLPDGEFSLAGLPVKVSGGVVRLENGALAGSTLRFHQALRNVWEITGLPLETLIGCASWNQAKSLRLKDVGKVEPGWRADLVVLDARLEPRAVFVDGENRLPLAQA